MVTVPRRTASSELFQRPYPLFLTTTLTSLIRNIAAAADKLGVDLEVTYEPFFLNRNTPEEGEDLMEHLRKKYGAAAIER